MIAIQPTNKDTATNGVTPVDVVSAVLAGHTAVVVGLRYGNRGSGVQTPILSRGGVEINRITEVAQGATDDTTFATRDRPIHLAAGQSLTGVLSSAANGAGVWFAEILDGTD